MTEDVMKLSRQDTHFICGERGEKDQETKTMRGKDTLTPEEGKSKTLFLLPSSLLLLRARNPTLTKQLVQGGPSGRGKPPVELDLGCSAILPGQ